MEQGKSFSFSLKVVSLSEPLALESLSQASFGFSHAPTLSLSLGSAGQNRKEEEEEARKKRKEEEMRRRKKKRSAGVGLNHRGVGFNL
jgi:hypothetical protein